MHWGATSQDILDTGLVVRLCSVAEIYSRRFDRLIDRLADLADAHRGTVMLATGSAPGHAEALADDLAVDATRMTTNLSASNGLVLAEAITFALAEHMPRAEAVALIKTACETVRTESRPLIEVVQENTNLPLDWSALGDPAHYLGSADRLIDQAIAAAKGRVE